MTTCLMQDSVICVIEERVTGLTKRVDGIEHRFEQSIGLLQKMFWGIILLLLTNLAGLVGALLMLYLKG